MKDFFSWKLVGLAATFIIGPLTYLVVRNVKAFWLWLDRQPASLQRVFVLVVAFALTAGAQLAGFTLPGECAALGDGLLTDSCKSAVADPVFVKTIMATLVAMFLHLLKKSEPDA